MTDTYWDSSVYQASACSVCIISKCVNDTRRRGYHSHIRDEETEARKVICLSPSSSEEAETEFRLSSRWLPCPRQALLITPDWSEGPISILQNLKTTESVIRVRLHVTPELRVTHIYSTQKIKKKTSFHSKKKIQISYNFLQSKITKHNIIETYQIFFSQSLKCSSLTPRNSSFPTFPYFHILTTDSGYWCSTAWSEEGRLDHVSILHLALKSFSLFW